MLFRVYNIKWREGITTATPDEMFIPVFDKEYEQAAESAKKYMAVHVRTAMEWTEDREFWHLRTQHPVGIPGILGRTNSTLIHCVEQMQDLLLKIDATDKANSHLIRMTNYQIQKTAELFKQVQGTSPVRKTDAEVLKEAMDRIPAHS